MKIPTPKHQQRKFTPNKDVCITFYLILLFKKVNKIKYYHETSKFNFGAVKTFQTAQVDPTLYKQPSDIIIINSSQSTVFIPHGAVTLQ